MIRTNLLFNKDRDLTEVDKVGFLDINSAFKNGVIDGNFAFKDEDYNRASPADLMHRPDDVFAGFRQRDAVRALQSVAAAAAAAGNVDDGGHE